MIPPAVVDLSQVVESASENDVVFAMTEVPHVDDANIDTTKNAEIEVSSGEIFMTAVPHNDNKENNDNHSSENDEAENAFYEDIGYNQLVADYNAAEENNSEISELYDKLTAKVGQCKELEGSIKDRQTDLTTAEIKTTAAAKQDATKQKDSDESMFHIRKMEEEAVRIDNSIPTREQHIEQLESEDERIKAKLAYGPGQTEEQEKEKSTLSNALEHSRTNATSNNNRLAELRLYIDETNAAVEESTKLRDESNAAFDDITIKIRNAEEKQQQAALAVRNAERSNTNFAESLLVAHSELAELKATCEGDKEILKSYEHEVEGLRIAQQSCTKEYDKLGQSEDKGLLELQKIRCENKEIEESNTIEQKELQIISKERDHLRKDRAKASKLRELISERTAVVNKGKDQLQNDIDLLAISTSKIESTFPIAHKEVEVIRREIKRAEHEYDMLSRKVGLSKQSSTRVAHIIQSNESTLLSQQNELVGINKAVDEKQRARELLVAEESRDDERLKRVYEGVQVSLCICCVHNSIHLCITFVHYSK